MLFVLVVRVVLLQVASLFLQIDSILHVLQSNRANIKSIEVNIDNKVSIRYTRL